MKDLLVFLVSEVNDGIIEDFKYFSEQLNRRHWNNESPKFIHEVDAEDCTYPDDEPIVTVGCVVSIPEKKESRQEMEIKAYQDVYNLIEQIEIYSRATGLEFEVELDGVYVGAIENGRSNEAIVKGLLEPWGKSLRGLE